MKISLNQKLTPDAVEGAIKLTNTTTTMLQNIILDFATFPYHFSECKIVRERGSLFLNSPNPAIALGNLYPQEVAYIYCKINDPLFLESTLNNYVNDIKVSFTPENNQLTTHTLSDFLVTSLNTLTNE